MISTSAVAPALAAICSAVRRMRRWMSWRTSASNVRMVPTISTSSGMMLPRTPPWMLPMVMMDGVRVTGSWRLATVCSPSTIWEETTIGSMPPQGAAPWVCRPRTTMRSQSALAIVLPARYDSCPTRSGPTCSPKMTSGRGFSKAPSSSISSAPPRSPSGAPSSAGWKMNLTVPGRSSRTEASTSATPMRMATWLSWPQACMTPTSWPL